MECFWMVDASFKNYFRLQLSLENRCFWLHYYCSPIVTSPLPAKPKNRSSSINQIFVRVKQWELVEFTGSFRYSLGTLAWFASITHVWMLFLPLLILSFLYFQTLRWFLLLSRLIFLQEPWSFLYLNCIAMHFPPFTYWIALRTIISKGLSSFPFLFLKMATLDCVW